MSETEETIVNTHAMGDKARSTLMTIFGHVKGLNRSGQPVDAQEDGLFDEAIARFVVSYASAHHMIFDRTSRERSPAWSVSDGLIRRDRKPDTVDFLILTGIIRHFEEHLGADLDKAGVPATRMSDLKWLRRVQPNHLDLDRAPPVLAVQSAKNQESIHGA